MKTEKFESQEHLLAYIMHVIAEEFPSNAVLKGGMVLRLTNSPRLTNDLDYVFVPFKSKKDIVELLLNCLEKIPGITFTHQLNSKCLRIVLTTKENISVQVEANVMKECVTATLTTQVLASQYALAPKVIKIVSLEVALANKMAAWCERRLVRDVFDIYYISSVLNKKPDLTVLNNRLLKLNYARNIKNKPTTITLEELSDELESYVAELNQEAIEEELGASFTSEESAGMDLIIRAGIMKLIYWLKKESINKG